LKFVIKPFTLLKFYVIYIKKAHFIIALSIIWYIKFYLWIYNCCFCDVTRIHTHIN